MSRSNVLLAAAASVAAGATNGGPAAAMICSSLVEGEFAAGERGSEIVGDRMLIVEGRRRERRARRAGMKRALRGVVGWTRRAACFSF